MKSYKNKELDMEGAVKGVPKKLFENSVRRKKIRQDKSMKLSEVQRRETLETGRNKKRRIEKFAENAWACLILFSCFILCYGTLTWDSIYVHYFLFLYHR